MGLMSANTSEMYGISTCDRWSSKSEMKSNAFNMNNTIINTIDVNVNFVCTTDELFVECSLDACAVDDTSCTFDVIRFTISFIVSVDDSIAIARAPLVKSNDIRSAIYCNVMCCYCCCKIVIYNERQISPNLVHISLSIQLVVIETTILMSTMECTIDIRMHVVVAVMTISSKDILT
jgi:hypothetical protein